MSWTHVRKRFWRGAAILGTIRTEIGILSPLIVSLYIDSTNFESYQRLRERSSPSWLESIQVYWLDPRSWMSVGHPHQAKYLLLHACYPFWLSGAIAVFSKQSPSLRLWVFRRTGWATGVTVAWTNGLDWPLVSPSLILSVSDGLFVAASHRLVWCLCLHLRQRFVELHCETLWRPRQLKHRFSFLTIFQRYWRAVITSQLVGKWGPVNTGRFLLSLKCAVFRGTWCASGPSVERGSDCGLYLAVWWVTWRVDLQSSFKDPNLL